MDSDSGLQESEACSSSFHSVPAVCWRFLQHQRIAHRVQEHQHDEQQNCLSSDLHLREDKHAPPDFTELDVLGKHFNLILILTVSLNLTLTTSYP